MSEVAIEERSSSLSDHGRQQEIREPDNSDCGHAESWQSSDGHDRRSSPKRLSLPVIQGCECGVAASVQSLWASCGYTALKHIACRCNDGVLVIDGTVHSFFFKQMAQEFARTVDGVHRIENRLNVNDNGANKQFQETDDPSK